MKTKTIIITALSSILFYSCGIKKYSVTMKKMSTTEIINIKYTEKQICEDIDYFIKSVEEVSPFPYMNADSLTIQALAKELKQKGDRMGNELYLDFMRLSAAFNVGHIYTFPPEAMLDEAIKNGDQFFPLFLKKNQGNWEIMGIIDNTLPEKNIGDRVNKINGMEMNEIIKQIEPLLANDGNSDEMIGNSFPFLLWAVKIGHPFSAEIIHKETGLSEVVQLQGTKDLSKYRSQRPKKENEKLDDYITFKNLDKNIGFMDAKSFYFVQNKKITKAFDKELESYFARLNEKGVSNLIIDLRENGGGSSYPAEAILRKIAHKPYQQEGGSTMRISAQFKEFIDNLPRPIRLIAKKGQMKNFYLHPIGTNVKEENKPALPKKVKNSFNGQVYVLIGPYTRSAAMMMANAVEDFDLGILVGEPTKSIPRELSNALPLKTPNAKVAFVVPATLFTRANGDANNFESVKPDLIIETKPEDVRLKIDPVIQHVFKRINQ
ncbi:MAG: S41 family peptidase [Sphingobacteriaceae bacterium]